MAYVREDLRIVDIHEREFQQYSVDRRIYCVPIDEPEEDRLATQHDLLYRFLGNKLFLPRIEHPRKILECGYGRGDWAVHVAEEYEQCQVTGVDIYPMMISEQPDNLYLSGYNLNDPLNHLDVFERNSYDLVHSRLVGQGVKASRWESYVQEMKRLLRPNGWLQMVEYYLNFQSHSGLLSSDSALTRWWNAYATAMQRSNRNPRVGQKLEQLMRGAGLRDVSVVMVHLPIGAWHPDAAKASIGRDSVDMVGELLDSLAIWPFTHRLGWTAAQVEALTNAARAEIQNASLKLYLPVYIATGRRRSG